MKVLKQFEFPATTNRSGKHDWTAWCDGQIRQIQQGVDYSGKTKWMQVQLRLAAKRKNLKVRMKADDTSITFQFYDPNTEQQQEQQQTTAKTKK